MSTDLDGWVGFTYVRMRGEHSRRKQSDEQRHRGGIKAGWSRKSSRPGEQQWEEEEEEEVGRRLGRGLGLDHSPSLGGQPGTDSLSHPFS